MVSDGMLSQDEIDALLKGSSTDNIETPTETNKEEKLNNVDYFSAMEEDAIGEIGNISFGSSATALSTLLQQKVEITTPSVSVVKKSHLGDQFQHPYVAIEVNYTEGFTGSNILVINQSDAAIIADLMMGGDGTSPDEMLGDIQVSAVQEAMNQMMGSAATSMSTVFNQKVDISPPTIDLLNISQNEGTDTIPTDELLVKISFRLRIGELIDSNLMQLLPLKFSKKIVKSLMGETDEPLTATTTVEPTPVQPTQQQPQQPTAQQPMIEQPVQQPMYEQPAQQPVYQQPIYEQPVQQQAYQQQQPVYEQPVYQQPAYTAPPANVQQAQFASFESANITQSEARNLNMLLDIPLQVTVELGRTKRSVKEILELSSGSIIELDKLAGEPVDILVNSRLIAKGEVVVIDENFGVRITDILSQADRLNNIR